jgi:L-threonylcarbamoyladenylate synthase
VRPALTIRESTMKRLATKVLSAADPAALARAVAVLRRGGLVCHPTDTVYGVSAGAGLPAAVERLYIVKERPRAKAIPLLLGDATDIERVARDIPAVAYRLMERFWPGALTIVLPAQPHVPAIVTAGSGTVALRLPDHAVPRALARALGAPLAATSANLSGRPSPRTAAEVLADLGGRVEIILDGGPCPGGVDSTVVDLTGERPRIARAGAIAAETLAPILSHRGEC